MANEQTKSSSKKKLTPKTTGKKAGKIAKKAAEKLVAIGEKIQVSPPSQISPTEEISVSPASVSPAFETETKSTKKPKSRSKRFREAKAKVDRHHFYPLEEAIKLAQETHVASFVGKIEAHLLVREKGKIGSINYPHFQTTTKKVAVADDKILAQLKEGKIDFDILLASPAFMSRLVPFARLLGPKGLMPNPKNGTLIKDPEKQVKKFASTGLEIKTEKKAPVIHTIVGLTNQKPQEIAKNTQALFKLVGLPNILKLTLAATMGPGVKVELPKIQANSNSSN